MSESNSTTQDHFVLTAPVSREEERKQNQKARSKRHYEQNREAILRVRRLMVRPTRRKGLHTRRPGMRPTRKSTT